MLSDASDAKPFPVPLGVLSVWQRSTRGDPLINMGKDDPLPKEADVVIIGSGLCGMWYSARICAMMALA
jgi:hypothetical protein